DRPEVLHPPQDPPRCCRQLTITVGVEVAAKTAQKHDYPSAAHRRSYGRRTAVERTFSTAKDPATNDLRRGWCRLMGLAPIALPGDAAAAIGSAGQAHNAAGLSVGSVRAQQQVRSCQTHT